MYGILRQEDDRRKKMLTGYVPYTSTPQELLGQKKISNIRIAERNPYPEAPVKDVLKASYERDLNKAQEDLQKYGYKIDNELSNRENKTFFNPYNNKVIFTTAGTDPTNLRDIGTDAYLAFLGKAGLKMTNRYKETEAVLNLARQKYKGSKKILVGHSLGNSILSTAANPNEKVYGFGTGSGIFQIPKAKQEERYRTAYDPLSFTSGATIIPSYIPKKKENLRGKQKVNYPQGIFPSHSYENLPSNIFV